MKVAKIISGIFCVVCASLGGIGFYLNKNEPEVSDYTIDYVYYIDGNVVESMPENIGSYDFDNYYCTNKVTGDWNEKEWKFVPNLTDNTRCELHFKTKTYEIKVDFNGASNQDSAYTGTSTVKKGESLEFIVVLEEGYGFDNVSCSNNEVGTYDAETNKVLIGPFNAASICTVNFKLNEYDVKLESTNGTPGSTSVKVEHGKNASIDLSPTTNYTLESVTCTNNQKGEWKNNKLTVTGVTKETTCTVKFKLQSYKVTVNVKGGSVDNASKTIAHGKSDSFTITADETHTLDDATVSCGTTATATLTNSKLQVSAVKGATTCTVTLKEKPAEPEPEPNEGTE